MINLFDSSILFTKKYLSEFFNDSFFSYKKSFAQCGEDLITRFIFDVLKIKRPTYLDIGAYHPYKFSNTALFYSLGSSGINVEPNPILFKKFLRLRRRDVNLNLGIHTSRENVDFYIIEPPTLSTFSSDEAHNYALQGFPTRLTMTVPTTTISALLENYCNNIFPDFLSLDVEGMDFSLLQTMDLSKSSPKVLCVETISFSTSGQGKKKAEIFSLLDSLGYFSYADTYINTIFVSKDLWDKLK